MWSPGDYSVYKGKGKTVRDTLLQLGAYCKDGQLYDRTGTPIIFQRIQCEGPPPNGYNDTEHWGVRQQKELAKLRAEFTVITYCGFIP